MSKVPVTILAFDDSVEMSIVISRDMFYAGAVAWQHKEGDTGSPAKMVKVASRDGSAVRSFSGSQFQPDCSIEDIEHTELTIVSGIWSEPQTFLAKHLDCVQWLRKQYQQGAMIACMHTGAFLLAEAGILDGQAATVYWRMVKAFQRRYPKVILQAEKKITSTGRVFCASGVSSGFEMASFLLERLWGFEVAQRVASHFLMDLPKIDDNFQLALDSQKRHQDQAILNAQQWLETHFSSQFLLEEVADKVGLSLRSFRRRFNEATGETPMQYLHRIRLETAKQLLQQSSLGIEQIAYRVGYEDASYFARLFKKKAGQTPGEFRLLNNN